jgi:DNA-binding IclR family transcriptional regulator
MLSLTEIAEEAGISKSTAHRMLATMESKRFLIRSMETGKYQLGYRFLEMATQVLKGANHQWAYHYLKELSDKFGETVDLAILDGDRVIYLQVIESTQRVKIAAAVGQRLPAYCTATGKAFLAFLPEEQKKSILKEQFEPFTSSTILRIEDLERDLEIIHQRGFSYSRQEFEKDINAVAAPILAEDGFPLAAIAIVGPTYRLPEERLQECGKAILEVIQTIIKEVGLGALSIMVARENPWR